MRLLSFLRRRAAPPPRPPWTRMYRGETDPSGIPDAESRASDAEVMAAHLTPTELDRISQACVAHTLKEGCDGPTREALIARAHDVHEARVLAMMPRAFRSRPTPATGTHPASRDCR